MNTNSDPKYTTKSDRKKKTTKTRSDTAVQGTNDSSIVSKCSMSERGYFKDDFLQHFILKLSRRSPLINRGYYIRAEAINHALSSFLSVYRTQTRQIVSLGAGFDSAFFRLKSQGLMENVVFIEVDFEELMKRKLNCIQHANELRDLLSADLLSPTEGGYQGNIVLNTVDYKLLGIDLTSPVSLTRTFEAVGVDFSLPTFVLSEVVMTYLQPNHSSAVIGWAAETFQNSVFVTYEQVEPADAFGTFMCDHFKKRGSPLRSIETYPSIQSQVQRYCELGWTETAACDMNYFYHNLVSPVERLRVEAIEPFDEYEEFLLKCSHYILLTAFNGLAVKNCYDDIWTTITGDFETLSSNNVPNDNCRIVTHQRNGYFVKGFRSPLTTTASDLKDVLRDSSDSCSTGPFSDLKSLDLPKPQVVFSDCTLSAVGELENSVIMSWCQVIGHTATSVVFDGHTFLVLAGGFGISNGRHQRLNNVTVVHPSDLYGEEVKDVVNDCSVKKRMDSVWLSAKLTEPVPFERMYHTATCIGGNKIILFGGRTSPVHCFNDISLLEVSAKSGEPNSVSLDTPHNLEINKLNELTDFPSSNDVLAYHHVSVTCEMLKSANQEPCSRWKHSASFSVGVARLFVFGGRSLEQHCLGDCWGLDYQKMEWIEVIYCQKDVLFET